MGEEEGEQESMRGKEREKGKNMCECVMRIMKEVRKRVEKGIRSDLTRGQET